MAGIRPLAVASPERYDALLAQLDQPTDQFNRATDGTVAIDADYLLVVARKP
jgi:hypothetical protein